MTEKHYGQALSPMPGMKAPFFEGKAYLTNRFCDIKLDDYKGYWLVLFFYPLDYDNITPTDLLGLNDQYKLLKSKGCHLLGVSTSSCLIHEWFASLNPLSGGVKGLNFPLLEDTQCNISKTFGVLRDNSGHSFRAFFIIGPDSVIRARMVVDLPVGLGVRELVRQVVHTQLVEETGGSMDCCGVAMESLVISHDDVSVKEVEEPDTDMDDQEFYNKVVLKEKDTKTGKLFQSPINIDTDAVKTDNEMGPILVQYIPPWHRPHFTTLPHPVAVSGSKYLDKTSYSQKEGSNGLKFTTGQENEEEQLHPQPTLVRNTPHYWLVQLRPRGTNLESTVSGGPLGHLHYQLYQYHAHWGISEHSVHGAKYDGELHMVHYNTRYKDQLEAVKHTDGLCTVAIFLKSEEGVFKGELDKITAVLPRMKGPNAVEMTDTPVDHEKLLPLNRDYWAYKGSRSSGKKTENVTWVVMKEPLLVRPEVLEEMHEHFKHPSGKKIHKNSRHTQDIGDRSVFQPGKGREEDHHVKEKRLLSAPMGQIKPALKDTEEKKEPPAFTKPVVV